MILKFSVTKAPRLPVNPKLTMHNNKERKGLLLWRTQNLGTYPSTGEKLGLQQVIIDKNITA